MKVIKIGGVPEHFNLPWHLGIENGDFHRSGIEVNWKDFPDGTGAMCKALREKEIDGAVILTEGIIKDIVAGNPVKIVQEFISTPLIWGIHVARNSSFGHLEELEGQKAAISRIGSGSHLMAYVNAERLGWDLQKLDFEVVGTVEGAVEALHNGTAAYFMWEHFTTKPLVDKGVFRRLGDCPTPWPCFVVVFREDCLQESSETVKNLLNTLNSITSRIRNLPNLENELAERYQQKTDDIEEWLQLTEWSRKQISAEELDRVQEKLLQLNLIPKKVDKESFLKF